MADGTPSLREILALTQRLSALHRELGIPARYAVDRKLEPHFEAREADLVSIGLAPGGKPIRLLPAAAAAWDHLHRAARAQRIELVALSGFRSIERQAAIIREKCAAGQTLDDILRSVAAPGFSEHHTGRALDLGSPEELTLDEHFATTPAFRWLESHAGTFGFRLSYPPDNPHGIAFEPWHWCWHAAR